MMRSRVVFYINTPTPLGQGQSDDYSPDIETRGMLRKAGGNRNLQWGEISTEDSYELICRFQSALESRLASNGKVIVDGKEYTINTWEKIDQIKHVYKFKLNTEIGS